MKQDMAKSENAMNRLSKIVFLSCGMLLAFPCHTQAPAGNAAAQKIVMVSFNDVVLHTAEAQKALSALQTKFAPRQAQLQVLNDEVEAIRKKIASPNEKASDAEKVTNAET